MEPLALTDFGQSSLQAAAVIRSVLLDGMLVSSVIDVSMIGRRPFMTGATSTCLTIRLAV
jgi:hypothetical protein